MIKNTVIIFLLLLSLTLGILLFTRESHAQTPTLFVVASGGANIDPTLFLVNPGTKTICVYQLQANTLRFISKRTFTRDFYVKDFRTK